MNKSIRSRFRQENVLAKKNTYESVPSPRRLHKESLIGYRDGYPWKADRTPIVYFQRSVKREQITR